MRLKSLLTGLVIAGSTAIFVLSSFSAVSAWTEPSGPPPGNNVAKPLNVNTRFIGDVTADLLTSYDSLNNKFTLTIKPCAPGQVLISSSSVPTGWACDSLYFSSLRGLWSTTTNGIYYNNGFVGVGTAQPNYLLDLGQSYGATAASVDAKKLAVYNNSNGSGFYGLGVFNGGMGLYVNQAPNGAADMAILSGGNVGIGSTTPNYKLSVNGTASVSDLYVSGQKVCLANGTNCQAGGGSSLWSTTTGGVYNTDLGKVGIGTSNMSAKLDINNLSSNEKSFRVGFGTAVEEASIGTENWNGYLSLSQGGTGGEKVRIRTSGNTYFNGGNVGIGTNVPSATLEVKGVGTGTIQLGQWAGANSYGMIVLNGDFSTVNNYNFGSSPADKNLYINRPTGNDIRFREGNIDQIIIQGNTGNLGIGSSTPNFKLAVNGTASVSDLLVNGKRACLADGTNCQIQATPTLLWSTSSSGIYNTSLSNVGIGSSTPGYKLVVNGDIQLTGAALRNFKGWKIVEGSSVDWLRINQDQSATVFPNGTAGYGNWAFGSGGVAIGGWTNPGVGNLTVTGNVGIASTTPNYKLVVNGLAWVNDLLINGKRACLADGTNCQIQTGSLWSVTANGIYNTDLKSVGIGTIPSSSYKLAVNGVGTTNVDFYVNGRLQSDNDNGGMWVSGDRFMGGYLNGPTKMVGFYNLGWRLSVDPSGNVGIATTTPYYKLAVNGTAWVNDLLVNGKRACLADGTNCPPASSGITGAGTNNYITKWNVAGTSLTNSHLFESADGSTINIGGNTSIAGNLDMNSQQIKRVATPTAGADAVNLDYLTTQITNIPKESCVIRSFSVTRTISVNQCVTGERLTGAWCTSNNASVVCYTPTYYNGNLLGGGQVVNSNDSLLEVAFLMTARAGGSDDTAIGYISCCVN